MSCVSVLSSFSTRPPFFFTRNSVTNTVQHHFENETHAFFPKTKSQKKRLRDTTTLNLQTSSTMNATHRVQWPVSMCFVSQCVCVRRLAVRPRQMSNCNHTYLLAPLDGSVWRSNATFVASEGNLSSMRGVSVSTRSDSDKRKRFSLIRLKPSTS